MLTTASLPEATRQVLDAVKDDPGIGDFRLIGGTAIALHHAHRSSEDLDFSFPEPKLQTPLVRKIIDRLTKMGFSAQLVTDEGARLYWENDGDGNIDDYQQDWAIDGVKVTFFCADSQERAQALRAMPCLAHGQVQVADSDSLFEFKGRLLTKRSMSRDMFDLWYYCAHRGKTVADIYQCAKAESPGYTDKLLRARLLPEKMSRRDPGFLSTLAGAPRDFDELKAQLALLVDAYDRQQAKRIAEEEFGSAAYISAADAIRYAGEATKVTPAFAERGRDKTGMVHFEWHGLPDAECARRTAVMTRPENYAIAKQALIERFQDIDPKGFAAWERGGRKPVGPRKKKAPERK
ncbi:MAG TPA: nucleotidyl transferase AbiEii/AbiGii toxin family protein [Rhodospirillaceae bacterium]|nr:nucleotidyl transferase AbiEii/AbiGii toxin family protein [Rhodospirillaceae bacterium]